MLGGEVAAPCRSQFRSSEAESPFAGFFLWVSALLAVLMARVPRNVGP